MKALSCLKSNAHSAFVSKYHHRTSHTSHSSHNRQNPKKASSTKDLKAPFKAFKPLALAIALVFSSTAPNIAQADTFTVTNTLDSGGGSLRQAVIDANNHSGNDIIQMSIPSGSTIDVSTQMSITDTVSIFGPSYANPAGVTLDGLHNSRHFFVASSSSPLTTANLSLFDMTLTNGYSAGQSGGSVYVRGENLLIDHSIISGNSTTGANGRGGGLDVLDGNITLTRSTVSGNSTTGSHAAGGGLHLFNGNLSLLNSTISGNSTVGSSASGGGLRMSNGIATLTESTISGNSTIGLHARGGGLSVEGGSNNFLTLIQSTISGNSTIGSFAYGGGIYLDELVATMTQSTISNNHSVSSGGGITFGGRGGVLHIKNSILSGNTGSWRNNFSDRSDSFSGHTVELHVESSLFGDSLLQITGSSTGTLHDPSNNPKLGPLHNNGGLTLTHNPLPVATSQIIDTGNNTFAPYFYDQRADGFLRLYNTTVDMGAVEWRPSPTEVLVRRDMARNIIAAIEGPAYTPPIAQNPIYDDVLAGDVNADWIAELKSRGFTEGCAANKFCPNMIVTKEQIAKVHIKAKQLDPPMPSANFFIDVPGPHNDFLGNPVPGAFAWEYITKMRDQGYSTGCNDDFGFINGFVNYCPDNHVTRKWFDSLLDALP